MENEVKNTEMEQLEVGTTRVEEAVKSMEKVKNFIDRHGLKGTFTTFLVFLLTAVVGYFAFNPEALFEKFEELKTEKHNNAVKARIEADPQIRMHLINLRSELNADRVYILETHNGGSNLTNLPFLYIDLTYSEPKSVTSWLEAEYTNLRLSRYPWAAYVYQNGFWFGSIKDVEKEDPELYYRLQKEEVQYMGMIMIYGKDSMPSGTLGIVYESDDYPDNIEILKTMQKYVSIFSALLVNDD